MGPDRIRNHRQVKRIDVGTMKPKEVKSYIQNLKIRWKYDNITSDEFAIDLRKYSKTTQILIENKWNLESKDWLGYDSKLFFRLWRFVYRDLQRKSGFEEDVEEYDKFIREWNILCREGDYIIVKSRKQKPNVIDRDKPFSSWIHNDLQKQKFNEHVKSLTNDTASKYFDSKNRPYTVSAADWEKTRLTQLNRFRNMIKGDSPPFDSYMGVTISDESVLQGFYNILMINEPTISRQRFKDIWEMLRVINGTSRSPQEYWGSKWGHIHNSMIMDGSNPQYRSPDMYNLPNTHCDIHTLTTFGVDDGKTYQWSFSRDLWESITHYEDDYKYKMTNVKRRDFNLFDEYMFRYLYYYSRPHIEVEELLSLPRCTYIPSQKSDEDEFMREYGGFITDREREETDMYRRKLQSLINIPTPPTVH